MVNNNPFKATGNAIVSLMSSVERLTTVIDKTIGLAENEVDALTESQKIRLDEVRFEREELKAQRSAKRANMDTDHQS